MTMYLSKEVQQSLNAALAQHKRNKARYSVKFDGSMYPVAKLWNKGFSLKGEVAPNMRGLVNLFGGTNHVFRNFIIASDEENGEVKFEFKRSTPPSDRAALDFARRSDAPINLLN